MIPLETWAQVQGAFITLTQNSKRFSAGRDQTGPIRR